MTFLEQQTEVGDLLNMTISANSTVDTTQVKRDLNTARDLVFNKLLSLGQDYNSRLAKADLVANQSLYGLPSDCRKLKRLEIGYESADTRRKARRIDENAVAHPDTAVFTTADPVYYLRGSNYEIQPTPTVNVTNGIWLLYIEDLTDMSSDTDTSGLPIDYDSLLVYYATAKGKMTLGLHNEAANYMALFKGGLSDMEDEIIDRNIDDNSMIIVREGYGGM